MPVRGIYRKANSARYDVSKGLVRMTWNRVNIINLLQRKQFPDASRMSMFKQRWIAKRETRAYHWDHISERQFLLRHFTPRIKLPDMGAADRHLYPPTAMLCFAELERRLDVVVHRCMFAPSVWAARGLVVQGYVKVNGEKVNRPSMSLRDGDIVTVDPAAVSLLMVPTAEDAAVTVDGTVGEAKEAPEAATSAAEGVSAASDAVEGSASKEGEASAAVEEVIATEGEQTGDPESGKSETSAGGRSRKGSWNSNGAHQSPASKHAWMKQTGKPLAFTPHAFMGPFTFVPEYLEVDYNICSAVFLRAPTLHPGRCEVPTPYPPEHHALTFEWYSRIYNRKTKRAPPEPMVIHGQPVKLKDKFRRILEHEAKQRSALFERTAAEAERERILATSAAMIGGNVGKQPEARL